MTIKKEKIRELIPHIIGLIFIAVLPLFLFDQSDARILSWTYRYYYLLMFSVLAFYGNYLIIVPRYFFTRKRIRFFIGLCIFAAVLISASQVIIRQYIVKRSPVEFRREGITVSEQMERMTRPVMNPKLLDDVLILLLVFGFSTGMRVLQQSHKEEEQKKEMEKAHIENELAFLKSQVNPHFFFNSLNNIYALIDVDSDAAQKAVEKLSGLMRYLIYETNVKTVGLQKELAFCSNYIDLMRQRLTSKVKVSVDIQPDTPDIEIPPLIFIPFIENAFKHGVSYREESFISIALKVHDEEIRFTCKNSIPRSDNKRTDDTGGMGIANIKKRLNLIYGTNAQLIQYSTADTFNIELTLPTNLTI